MSATRTIAVHAAPAARTGVSGGHDGPMVDEAGGQEIVERAAKIAAVPVGALGDFCGHDSRLLCRRAEHDDARPFVL